MKPADRDGASEVGFLLAVCVVACLVIVLRRPDAVLNPQFYLEDGQLWFAEAHDFGGLRSLFTPSHRGYFHTAERLGAWLAVAVPLGFAPLVSNAVAIAAEALPAVLLTSRRYAHVASRLPVRLGLAFVYLALPGIWGLISNLTHAQWHLAVLACLVVLAAPPTSRAWKAFDVPALILSGLTGPTCIVLVPVAAAIWYARRSRWAGVVLGVVSVTACVQAASLMLRAAPVESHAPLGESVGTFLRLVAQRVVYAALVGQRASAALLVGGALASTAVVAFSGAAGLAVLGYAVVRGPLELKLLIAFGAMVLCLALLWPIPVNYVENGYWAALAAPGAHSRYFYPLTFAFILSLAWAALRGGRIGRVVAALALAPVLLCAIPLDFREPAYRDYHFAEYVERYRRAAPGERVQIPTPPDWSMILTKR